MTTDDERESTIERTRQASVELVLAVALVAIAGCRVPGPERRDAIEVLVADAPATLDPRFATDATGVRITRLVHAGLVRLDEATLAPIPYVAKGWTWDGTMALRVTLRDDVRFRSGAPVEVEDVCATLAAIADPSLGSPHRPVAASIDRCERTGPHELRIALKTPRATLVTDLEVPILRRDQARLPLGEGLDLDGLGPFAIAERHEDAVLLAARDGGALPRPRHDVEIRAVHDENARAVRLLAKRADVVPNALSPTSLDALADRGVAITTRPGANLTYLLLHDERLGKDARRAIATAIDRATLAKTLLGGRARVAESFLPPESWAFSPPATPIAFDPHAARDELARAGVHRLTILTSSDRARATLGRAMAQMLGDAGVETDVVPLDLGVLLARLSAGDFEAALLQMPEISEPNLLKWFFASSSIPIAGGPTTGANRARYRSADVDRELEAASIDPDPAARKAHYAAALARMLDDVPVVPLFHEDEVAAVSPRAATFRLGAEGRWLGLADLP